MANVAEIINKTYTKLNGEYEEQVEGSDDWNTYLNVLNQVKDTWALWPYVKWQSLFVTDYSAGTVTTDQLAYQLDDFERIVVANSPLDNVYLLDDDGTVVKTYKLVDQAEFQSSDSENIVSWLGDTLYFKVITDEIEGLTINVPVYMIPEDYTDGSDDVVIDSVPWLTTYMAAFIADSSPVPFIARNADKFYKQADILMKTMRMNNRRNQRQTVKRAGGGSPFNQDQSYLSRIESLDDIL